MTGIHITDIESAINFWRDKLPCLKGAGLPEPTQALAEALQQIRRADRREKSGARRLRSLPV